VKTKRLPPEVTLERYTEAVCGALETETEPVLLVGHSMGGIVISQVAERRPERIRGLVYVSGYLLCDGQAIRAISREDENMAKLAQWLISDGTYAPSQLRGIGRSSTISALNPMQSAPLRSSYLSRSNGS
jgi:pimeloyl-ACP methyl ester carboxylesterase